jgi:hypothetical protein
MQLALFEVPEHAWIVTSLSYDLQSFRVQLTFIPRLVLLHSLKHEGHVDLGWINKDDKDCITIKRRF